MEAYVFGVVGGTIGICSQIPQLIKSWKSKKTRDLSILTYLLLVANNSLWLLHGIYNGDTVLVITNSIAVFIPIGVLVAKIKFG